MLHDTRQPTSSLKGKSREETSWQLFWSDFYPLVEGSQRPVVWTCASTILTAHPTQPLIVGLTFPTRKQFVVPSPSPVLNSPGLFDPPTIISVSTCGDWLFAFFPGRGDADGTGCLWKRDVQVDRWIVLLSDTWGFPRGSGVVTASWLGPDREWTASDGTPPSRLPALGPRITTFKPTLLLVTQIHEVLVCHVKSFPRSMKLMRASLSRPISILENAPPLAQESTQGSGGVRICIKASIGLAYNDASLLIVTRSVLLPTMRSPDPPTYTSTMDPEYMTIPPREPTHAPDWEIFGEECTIELCEVRLGVEGHLMTLSTTPLPSLHYPSAHLTNLVFIPASPRVFNVQDKTKEEAVDEKQTGDEIADSPMVYLAASSLDFADYASPPQSQLSLFSLFRTSASSSQSSWTSHLQTTRVFAASAVLSFLIPVSHNLLAGVIHTEGTFSGKDKRKETCIGKVSLLQLPYLGDGETSKMMCGADVVMGKDLPLSATVSPNRALICTVSSTSLFAAQTSIHSYPQWHPRQLQHEVLCAIVGRRSPADLVHVLSQPSAPLRETVNTLNHALTVLQKEDCGYADTWMLDVFGVATDVYRTRARNAEGKEYDDLTEQWLTAHAMCSVAACDAAFEECIDDEGYDLNAVWQLIGMSNWLIDLVEMIMKEAVMLESVPFESEIKAESGQDDLFTPTSPVVDKSASLPAAALLHLLHPFPLRNLRLALSHLNRFRQQLGSISARGEIAQIAKDVLIDLVDLSGVNLDVLESALAQLLDESPVNNLEELSLSLVSCRPTPSFNARLHTVVTKLTTAEILDRPRLFIKRTDLADSFDSLSVSSDPDRQRLRKDKYRDVITKGLMARNAAAVTCLRCGGKSELHYRKGSECPSLRWRSWEKMWARRCLCGGCWAADAS